MQSFFEEESGTTAIEYALIASMATMVLAGAFGVLRDGVNHLFETSAALTSSALG